MGRRYPISYKGGSQTTYALGAVVVVAILLFAGMSAVVVIVRGKATVADTYVSGPGPMLDPEVPIKSPSKWDAFYAFFGRP